jgi:hypothetical protein
MEQALLALFQGNPLLAEAGVAVERLSCGSVAAPADSVHLGERGNVEPHFLDGEGQADDSQDEIDEFESGLYLYRWPNGEFSVVKADNRREALIELDEWAGADPAWLIPISTWMVDFRLNDQGEIELAQFGEETADFVWDRCYPELEAVLSGADVTPDGRIDAIFELPAESRKPWNGSGKDCGAPNRTIVRRRRLRWDGNSRNASGRWEP